MSMMQTRRCSLTTVSMAGAAGILPARPARAAEPALETTTVRLPKVPVICFAPLYVCEALLRAEGFTDIRYVDSEEPNSQHGELGRGRFDFAANLSITYIT